MDFGKIINKSFQFTKKHKLLWGLGILAALTQASGGFTSFNFPSGNIDTGPFENSDVLLDTVSTDLTGQFSSFVSNNALYILLGFVLAIALGAVMILYLLTNANTLPKLHLRDAAWRFGLPVAAGIFFVWNL